MTLMSFIQGKTVHGLGEGSISQAVGLCPEGSKARASFLEHLKRQRGNRA